jgi:hypothetical protein
LENVGEIEAEEKELRMQEKRRLDGEDLIYVGEVQ